MYQIYQIMLGDTLEKVANKYGTTSNNIAFINGIDEVETLVPGTYLVVPKIENKMFNRYIVKKGDNLYSIASRFGVSIDLLEMLNGLEKGSYIYPNQELMVPNEDVLVYITKNETFDNIANQLGVDVEQLISSNSGLYVVPEQLVVYKTR